MDNTLLVALIGASTGIVGGGLGILGTYVAAVVKFRQDLKVEYDKDLRTERIAALPASPVYKCNSDEPAA